MMSGHCISSESCKYRQLLFSGLKVLHILWTIAPHEITKMGGSCLSPAWGYFPISPFLRPSKNKCCVCQMSGKLKIQVSFPLLGITCILEKKLPNLIVRIFENSFFYWDEETELLRRSPIRFSRPHVPST